MSKEKNTKPIGNAGTQHICCNFAWSWPSTLTTTRRGGKKLRSTHISTPAVGREDLILLVEVEDLDEGEAVADVDRLRRVVDGPADTTHPCVVVEQVLDESLLVRQSDAV